MEQGCTDPQVHYELHYVAWLGLQTRHVPIICKVNTPGDWQPSSRCFIVLVRQPSTGFILPSAEFMHLLNCLQSRLSCCKMIAKHPRKPRLLRAVDYGSGLLRKDRNCAVAASTLIYTTALGLPPSPPHRSLLRDCWLGQDLLSSRPVCLR